MASILIAAASGRALAASARRGGYAPLVADFFGDQDTIQTARAHVRVEGGLAGGMAAEAVVKALESLSRGEQPEGLIWGTGFEDRPALLARLAQRWTLLGNGPETVALTKDPIAFAELCRDRDIPHPETSMSRPSSADGWLAKRRGGAGGAHVRPAAGHDVQRADIYFQRRVPGTPVSLSFLADGRRALVLGPTAQWTSPTRRQPYRYGGAVGPAPLSPDMGAALAGVVEAVMARVPLVGLNSADFLVGNGTFHLLEINPRPGATLDIFEPDEGSLVSLHVAACRGQLPDAILSRAGAMASALVYADRDIRVTARDWPDWTADRPQAGTLVGDGEPYCTVLARAPGPLEAKRLVEDRQRAILHDTAAEAA